MDVIRQLLTRLGELAAHPGAFGILIAYAVLWLVFDRESLDWHATTTLIVWFMTLLIQRAEHRDGEDRIIEITYRETASRRLWPQRWSRTGRSILTMAASGQQRSLTALVACALLLAIAGTAFVRLRFITPSTTPVPIASSRIGPSTRSARAR